MSFFPLFPTSDVTALCSNDVNIRIPSFSMDACQNILHIASGSFANVYSCILEGQKHVLKKLNYVEDDDDNGEQSLFLKEVLLLDRLRGHQNIVEIEAYCYPKRALLMEYVSFSVECINLKAQQVYSLDKLLKVLLPGEFVGCSHLALNIAIDVATGLQFMHSKGVVHRDLKSANVLVSNSHYANLNESDVKKWWLVKPIVCKLTDFGESRSCTVKTRLHMTSTLSRNLARGSPAYQAPEIYIGSKAGITLVEYKQMDIWSFAMIMFDLMNPHAYPYKEEISKLPAPQNAHSYLEEKHKHKVLPLFSNRFRELQQSVWRPLRKVYDSCAVHLPSKRPPAKEIVIRLTNEHVKVQNLPVSQSVGGGKFSTRNRQNVEDHSSTRNACAFLDIIIADRLLKRVSGGPVTKDVIIEVCSDAITNFPEEINSLRDLNEYYGINEAYEIVRSCEACDAYNIQLTVFSQTAKMKSAAMDELKGALSKLVVSGKPFAALYVVPPTTVLLCSLTPMTLFVVDKHAVPKVNNGNEENGAVVTSMHGETAVIAIVNWLFSRLCKGKCVHQELGVLSPLNAVAISKLADDNSIEPKYTSVNTNSDRMARELSSSVTSVSSSNASALDPPHTNQANVNSDSVKLDMSSHSICAAFTANTDESLHGMTTTNAFISPMHLIETHPVTSYDDGQMGRMARELQTSVTPFNSSLAGAALDLSCNVNQVKMNTDTVALDMSCNSACTATTDKDGVTKTNSFVSPMHRSNVTHPVTSYDDGQMGRMARELHTSVTSFNSSLAGAALDLSCNVNQVKMNTDTVALDMSCNSAFTATTDKDGVTKTNSFVSPMHRSNVTHPVTSYDDGQMGRMARELHTSVTSFNSSLAGAALDVSCNVNQVKMNTDTVALDMSCNSACTATTDKDGVTKTNSFVSPMHRSNVTHPVTSYDDGQMGRMARELHTSVTSFNSSLAGAALDRSCNVNQLNMNADSIALDMSFHSAWTASNTMVNRQPFKEIDNRYVPDTCKKPHSVIKSIVADSSNQQNNNVSVVGRTSLHSPELAGGNDTVMRENVSPSARPEKAEAHFSTVYSRMNTWKHCEDQYVDCLPSDIDGLQKYVIKCNNDEMMAVTKDSRPWNTWVTTSRKGFRGRRRMAKCRGSLACVSETCSFLVAHKCSKRVQFQKVDGNMVCFSCNSIAEFVSCPAVKIWEHHKDLHAVVVYHHGRHTCMTNPQRPSSSLIVNAIKKYPRTPAVQILHNELVGCLRKDDVTVEELEKVCKDFGSLRQIRHFQQLARQEDNPCGDSGFDALISFKEKVSGMDKFLIYDVNGKHMNNKSAYVFKSSKDMAQLALEMDVEGNGFLREEFAYVDVKHDICRDYQTVTLWTYHPSMRKLLRLACMDIVQENTENLTQFWHIFNQMLREVSGQADYRFNPIGFISDEHHANFKAIKEVFGEVGAKRIKTCEFHFKQSVQRHMMYLAVHLRERFKDMAYNMLEAQSHSDCEAACVAMSSFCSRNVQVNGWYEWWYKRKEHIFRAYKATNTPHANIAEIGHAQMATWARTNTTLLEAAIDDVAYAIRQKHDIQGFLVGKHTGGTGIRVAKKRAKQHTADIKRAEAWARQLQSQFDAESTYVLLQWSTQAAQQMQQKIETSKCNESGGEETKISKQSDACQK